MRHGGILLCMGLGCDTGSETRGLFKLVSLVKESYMMNSFLHCKITSFESSQVFGCADMPCRVRLCAISFHTGIVRYGLLLDV
jgi:hypothetical protein